ncbi:TetR family transcriptional regulator [Devosia sp. XJ19-1]|uniref:TetR family transcriptional regulator n=1 Tax=Devosia ureilytica TaxID=2952754 RepID=A0A9Q4FU37_9HYPH|nr:TetR/AcrR family transcriptional regulator [Devosia ureilytica]MCP8884679.1 TetR family transcriptional regulator [Devosia ureilytica]MCP8888310.1 TetR family transcriptional regulator [Devosia ureilytica]
MTKKTQDGSAPASTSDAAPRQKRNADETRAKILKAARAEFSQNGFAGARVDKIVAAAKTNPRMVYHYFGGKAGLYIEVLEDALGRLRKEELKIDVEHLTPLEGLMQLFDFMHDHFEADMPLVSLLRNENLQKARHMKSSKRIREMSSPVRDLIANLLRRGEQDKCLRPGIDPLQLYVMMVALNQFHLSNAHTLSVIFEEDLMDAEWRRCRHDAARTMLRAYLSKP